MALEKLIIQGGQPLEGEIWIAGAKNAALPLMALPILSEGKSTIRNVPALSDVQSMAGILENLGLRTELVGDTMVIENEGLSAFHTPYELVRKMRASILMLGPLVARHGQAVVSLPGGCAIGVRPIDLHLKALEALGARIDIQSGDIHARAPHGQLKGGCFDFPFVTVLGTVNAMIAASLASGETLLRGCAREPEVVTVAEGLNLMGAHVEGAGTSEVCIQGVDELKPLTMDNIFDRIEAGTYMVAAAITGGDLTLLPIEKGPLQAMAALLRDAGHTVGFTQGAVRVKGQGRSLPIDIETAPFPGFPTDMQAQFVALTCLASGRSHITENIFENRFMHVPELARMGANITIRGKRLWVDGVDRLKGAPVMATDLRASASLVLAGLAAEGQTEVARIYHLDRGYETMDAKLKGAGAKIERVQT